MGLNGLGMGGHSNWLEIIIWVLDTDSEILNISGDGNGWKWVNIIIGQIR